ncbi:hypothetical protein QTO34_002854 [Cnephaeus nilssonii]|uniref:Uncharacterized protein n=1 Tax=Cnephaeus nilssonii TaxID=3371016 RepID=A0AA40HT19_CNENI|nr:hypothetical protein QTO34_002854 [Eptesicus nilssonii]
MQTAERGTSRLRPRPRTSPGAVAAQASYHLALDTQLIYTVGKRTGPESGLHFLSINLHHDASSRRLGRTYEKLSMGWPTWEMCTSSRYWKGCSVGKVPAPARFNRQAGPDNWRLNRSLRTWDTEGEELLRKKECTRKAPVPLSPLQMALQEARKAGEDLGIHAFPVMERVNPNSGQVCFRTIGSSIRSLQIGLHELRLKDREGRSVGNGLLSSFSCSLRTWLSERLTRWRRLLSSPFFFSTCFQRQQARLRFCRAEKQ